MYRLDDSHFYVDILREGTTPWGRAFTWVRSGTIFRSVGRAYEHARDLYKHLPKAVTFRIVSARTGEVQVEGPDMRLQLFCAASKSKASVCKHATEEI